METKAASSGRGSPRSSTLREQEVTGQTLIIIAEAWSVVLIATLILSSWSQSPCDDEPLHGPRASCTCLKKHNKDKGKQAWTVQGTKGGSASSTLATRTCSLKTRPKNSNQATMGIRCRLPGPSSSTPARSFASKGSVWKGNTTTLRLPQQPTCDWLLFLAAVQRAASIPFFGTAEIPMT